MHKRLPTALVQLTDTPMKLSTFAISLLVLLTLAALARCTALAH